ncbi:AAA family ATPase [Demequina sp.]|uniref:AAA family ATPase n=1 Tax=Demequina sp. TaxID=2050685 RepID=UPI0025B9FD54|nr:AAA family ATPase [Demequina sp.]
MSSDDPRFAKTMVNQQFITHIRAEGVLGTFTYDVEFPEENDEGRIRAVYAPNGRGKTNFLRAVAQALTPSIDSLQSLVEIPFASIKISFLSGGTIVLSRDEAFAGSFTAEVKETAVTHPMEASDGARISVDPQDFAGRLFRRAWESRLDFHEYVEICQRITGGCVFIGEDRLSPTLDDMREAQRSENMYSRRHRSAGTVSDLLASAERMLNQSALATISNERRDGGVYSAITRTTLAGSLKLKTSDARDALEAKIEVLLQLGQPLERYGLISLSEVRSIAAQLHSARTNARPLPTLHQVLAPFLDSLVEQVNALQPAYDLIHTFVTEVNRFLDRKELRFTAALGIELVGLDRSVLHADSLSSGERHLIYLLTHALLVNRTRALLIIDEPEISLGIEWQRDICAALLRCSSFGQSQVIFASHSVQVLAGLPEHEIVQPTED